MKRYQKPLNEWQKLSLSRRIRLCELLIANQDLKHMPKTNIARHLVFINSHLRHGEITVAAKYLTRLITSHVSWICMLSTHLGGNVNKNNAT